MQNRSIKIPASNRQIFKSDFWGPVQYQFFSNILIFPVLNYFL